MRRRQTQTSSSTLGPFHVRINPSSPTKTKASAPFESAAPPSPHPPKENSDRSPFLSGYATIAKRRFRPLASMAKAECVTKAAHGLKWHRHRCCLGQHSLELRHHHRLRWLASATQRKIVRARRRERGRVTRSVGSVVPSLEGVPSIVEV